MITDSFLNMGTISTDTIEEIESKWFIQGHTRNRVGLYLPSFASIWSYTGKVIQKVVHNEFFMNTTFVNVRNFVFAND